MNVELCEKLAARAASGDATASRSLVEHLWPVWVEMVRGSRSLGELGRSEDHVHDVVAKLVEKIGRADGRGLRLYAPWREKNPEKTFEDWIRIVTKNAIRDHLRKQIGPRRPGPNEPSLKRLLNEFASSPLLDDLGVRPPLTAAQTARELAEFARTRLPTDQFRLLGAWLEGASFEDMAKETATTPEDARKLVRAAIATLRRHFAPDGAPLP
jgi:DNA-directed RNA polymerase specialized sigma24 family protein